MTKKRRPDGEETVHFHGRIAASLFMKLSVLAIDPRTGRIPYGGWTKLLETMVSEFIERRSSPSVDPATGITEYHLGEQRPGRPMTATEANLMKASR